MCMSEPGVLSAYLCALPCACASFHAYAHALVPAMQRNGLSAQDVGAVAAAPHPPIRCPNSRARRAASVGASSRQPMAARTQPHKQRRPHTLTRTRANHRQRTRQCRCTAVACRAPRRNEKLTLNCAAASRAVLTRPSEAICVVGLQGVRAQRVGVAPRRAAGREAAAPNRERRSGAARARVCVCVCVCACARVCVRVHLRACVRAHVHFCPWVSLRPCARPCLRGRVLVSRS